MTTLKRRGHPRIRGLQIRESVHVRVGSFRGRCLRTRGTLPAYKKYWSTDLRINTFPLSSVENELKQYFSFSILVKNLTLITTGLAKFG